MLYLKVPTDLIIQLLNFLIKYKKSNDDGDMLSKQRTGSINKYCVLNKNIKSPFEKKNEKI